MKKEQIEKVIEVLGEIYIKLVSKGWLNVARYLREEIEHWEERLKKGRYF